MGPLILWLAVCIRRPRGESQFRPIVLLSKTRSAMVCIEAKGIVLKPPLFASLLPTQFLILARHDPTVVLSHEASSSWDCALLGAHNIASRVSSLFLQFEQ